MGKFFTSIFAILSTFYPISAYPYGCKDGTALISGGTTYPPLSWLVDDRLTGTSIELVSKIFLEIGIKAESDAGGPWKRVLLRAQKGQVDMLVGVRRNETREQYLQFVTPPITPAVQSVFVKRGSNFAYSRWQDLEGKLGGVTLGASFGKEFDQFARENLSLDPVRTVEQNFKKLKIGRIDYLLGPLLPTLLYSDLSGDRPHIQFQDQPLIIIEEFVAFSKASACKKHFQYFNKRIAEIQQDGTIDELLEKYFEIWHNFQ